MPAFYRSVACPGPIRTGFLLLLCLTALPALAQEQTTFAVTLVNKTPAHPFYQQGFAQGFAIDGTEGKELTLTRGIAYTFQMQSTPSLHPFYITTSMAGAGGGTYSEGVQGNGATGIATLRFTPGANTPDLLYYNCMSHPYMGGRLVIRNATGTAGEDAADLPRTATLAQNYPNPFNPATTIRFELAQQSSVTLVVYDLLGREVRRLVDGVRPAGTYTVEWDGRDDAGRLVPSGSYAYRLAWQDGVQERLMTLLK